MVRGGEGTVGEAGGLEGGGHGGDRSAVRGDRWNVRLIVKLGSRKKAT